MTEQEEVSFPFKSVNLPVAAWFHIPGRGWLAQFEKETMQYLNMLGIWDPTDLQNRTILLDGNIHHVRGVGTKLINRSPQKPYQLPFSFLIDGQPARHDNQGQP